MSPRFHKRLRRLTLGVLVLVSTAAATGEMVRLLRVNGFTFSEGVLTGLFAVSFGWLALSFWTTLAGLASLIGPPTDGGLRPPAEDGPLGSRTAVVMPIYHEDPRLALANLEAVLLSVEATGHGAAFDFWVLSDSQRPASWVAEEAAWAALCARHGSHGRVFYRRRPANTAKKAGNIADFCRRWGRRYDFLVVLDADSLMTGETLVRLARLMQANPDAGILQVPPLVIGGRTPFALAQQFASRVYGPAYAAGLAFWHLDDSNYWGHNAILRTSAFIRYCGLPELRGRAPFGGHILSHDFVEAALMRRAGFGVWLLPELGGSYEEAPPTVLDFARRDQRWCRGNLQHLAVIGAPGLRPMSRLHLFSGVMAYGSSLLWLLLILAGLGAALQDRFVVPVYFSAARSLFPDWPVYDVPGGIRLIALAAVFLFGPKLLALVVYLARLRARRLRAVASFLVETVWSMVIAPSFMLWHSGFIVKALLGRDVGWEAQEREGRAVRWGDALARHAWHLPIAAGLALGAWMLLPTLLVWLAPVIVGLALGPLATVVSSQRGLAGVLGRAGLLETPEAREPPPVIALARRLREAPAACAVPDPLAAVVADPSLNALHVAVLHASGQTPSRPELVASARRKLAARPRRELTPDEERQVMLDPVGLVELHLEHRRATAGHAAKG